MKHLPITRPLAATAPPSIHRRIFLTPYPLPLIFASPLHHPSRTIPTTLALRLRQKSRNLSSPPSSLSAILQASASSPARPPRN